ncbi:hypothetical protein HaLaN_27802, partial [Haematococcus lacustris]
MTVSGEEVNALRLALAQPPPLHRLIVVVSCRAEEAAGLLFI